MNMMYQEIQSQSQGDAAEAKECLGRGRGAMKEREGEEEGRVGGGLIY